MRKIGQADEAEGASDRRQILVGLSTASVYPQNTEAAFRYAAELGYDGIELMVWAEPASQSIAAVQSYVRKYDVPVIAIHAPCLLISQRVWGSDPVAKLERSVRTAEALGARTVVVHPRSAGSAGTRRTSRPRSPSSRNTARSSSRWKTCSRCAPTPCSGAVPAR